MRPGVSIQKLAPTLKTNSYNIVRIKSNTLKGNYFEHLFFALLWESVGP